VTDYAPLSASITKEEGRRYSVYQDSRGCWTVGDGFNIDARFGGGLDDVEIDFIREHRIAKAESLAEAYPWFGGLGDPRKMVVVDMLYNMGPLKFAGFHTTITCIAQGNWEGAAAGMIASAWASEVGRRATRLARIMETGVWEP